MSDHLLYFNGINIETGQYAREPMDVESIPAMLRPMGSGTKDLIAMLKSEELAQARWGLIVHEDTMDPIIAQLEPLISWRREQMKARGNQRESVFTYRTEHTLDHLRGQEAGLSSVDAFLQAREVSMEADVDPRNVPYYLLIAASPEDISFDFQIELGYSYAVGRLHFDDLEAYGRYARNVVAVERTGIRRPRKASFFGPKHDELTTATSEKMVSPLVEAMNLHNNEWHFKRGLEGGANKQNFITALEDSAFVYSAGHGVTSKKKPYVVQGSLILESWAEEKPPCSALFLPGDVTGDYRGLILWSLACYSAGTPRWDSFDFDGSRGQIAEKPFVSGLAKALLGSEHGPLAMVGHVDQSFTHSFDRFDKVATINHLKSTVHNILNCQRLGQALKPISRYYGSLLQGAGVRVINGMGSGFQWLAIQDIRGYVILGDPAVRLQVH